MSKWVHLLCAQCEQKEGCRITRRMQTAGLKKAFVGNGEEVRACELPGSVGERAGTEKEPQGHRDNIGHGRSSG